MTKINKKFWNNRKVLITGHTGFKGSWLSLWLHYMNANVLGYSLPLNKKNILYRKLNLNKKIQSKFGDICDDYLLKKTVMDFNPSIIFHLAAQPLVFESYKNPMDTFNTNIMGTAKLMNASIKLKKLESIIIVTSDKCYQNDENKLNFVEDDKLGGDDPYSCSKAAAELIANSFKKSFFKNVGIATARSGNVIGGGDYSKDRIIPDILKSISKRQNLILRNPQSTRPWQHVFDTLNGYLILAEKITKQKKKFSGGWNFGPEKNKITVKKLAEKLIKFSNSNIKIKHIKNKKYVEKKLLSLDSKKANIQLGWSNKWNINKSIEQIINWENHSNKNTISENSIYQIVEYMK